jgi:hypothetical protein
MDTRTTPVTPALHELIFDVFEGELGGAREIRLSKEEAEAIRKNYPSVHLTPLPHGGGGKGWYEMKFN